MFFFSFWYLHSGHSSKNHAPFRQCHKFLRPKFATRQIDTVFELIRKTSKLNVMLQHCDDCKSTYKNSVNFSLLTKSLGISTLSSIHTMGIIASGIVCINGTLSIGFTSILSCMRLAARRGVPVICALRNREKENACEKLNSFIRKSDYTISK